MHSCSSLLDRVLSRQGTLCTMFWAQAFCSMTVLMSRNSGSPVRSDRKQGDLVPALCQAGQELGKVVAEGGAPVLRGGSAAGSPTWPGWRAGYLHGEPAWTRWPAPEVCWSLLEHLVEGLSPL